MGDYPDSEDEFELMYGDELELLNEQPDLNDVIQVKPSQARRTLSFTGCSSQSKATASSPTNVPSQKSIFSSSQREPAPLVASSSVSQESVSNIATSTTLNCNARKRTIEELFGDIDDLLFESERRPKKQKGTKEEHDLALIEQIVEMRRLASQSNENSLSTRVRNLCAENLNQDNLSFRVPKYPFITVTRSDGERIYVRCHSSIYEKEDTLRILGESSFIGVMGDSFKSVWDEARDIMNKNMDSEIEEMDISEPDVRLVEPSIDKNKQLWVDKYKPKKYLDLLSDESVNRILLRWMKLWDKIVFNRKPKVKAIKIEDHTKNKYQRLELNTVLDEHGRPQHKVALLCGRPGLGKTTLAHVVAKHAGYNVVEINASDDRNLESFRTLLENSTQMRSVVDQQKRPNCVVFDEIDGAPAASIEYLVKFINGTISEKPKKGVKRKSSILKRPIICICNDVYVPALRSLRQIAFVVNFPPTSTTRLAERLMEIARRQQVKTDVGSMLALAEKSNTDIRSCLSVLHFFKAQNKHVTIGDIYKSSIGQKDMQKGLFTVWQDIFQVEKPKQKSFNARSLPKEDQREHYDMSSRARAKKVLDTVTSFGDYERLMQGVFENYPTMKTKASSLSGTCQALEWFCFSDILNTHIYAHQNYSLFSYLPYAFVVWHFVFSSLSWPKINYPRAGYEARLKKTHCEAVLTELVKGMEPGVRAVVNSKSLLLDILPLLTRIISPLLRPVSLHLFNKEEKQILEKVVNVMIDYNLNYIQEKNTEGVYEFKLDPDINTNIFFSNCKSLKRRGLSYFNKQLIAREIEVAKMKKFEGVKDTSNINIGGKQKLASPSTDPQLPNHLQRLKPKSLKKIEVTVTKDFFGRIVTKENDMTGKTGPELTNDIWFRYKEGYNNAVRKTIKISSLL